jgi:hypothetical protein
MGGRSSPETKPHGWAAALGRRVGRTAAAGASVGGGGGVGSPGSGAVARLQSDLAERVHEIKQLQTEKSELKLHLKSLELSRQNETRASSALNYENRNALLALSALPGSPLLNMPTNANERVTTESGPLLADFDFEAAADVPERPTDEMLTESDGPDTMDTSSPGVWKKWSAEANRYEPGAVQMQSFTGGVRMWLSHRIQPWRAARKGAPRIRCAVIFHAGADGKLRDADVAAGSATWASDCDSSQGYVSETVSWHNINEPQLGQLQIVSRDRLWSHLGYLGLVIGTIRQIIGLRLPCR